MAQNWKPNRSTASIYLFACAVGMFVAGILSITGGKVSTLRLGLFGLSILFSVGLCLLALWNLRSTYLADWWVGFTNGHKLGVSTSVTALIFLAGWIITWTPLERFGSAYYYVQGIYPFIIWLTCTSAIGAILLLSAQTGLNSKGIRAYFQDQLIIFIISILLLALFYLLGWIASTRVIGMQPNEEDFWYGAGVPILAFQVQLALVIGIGLAFLIDKWAAKTSASARRVDIAIFVLVWAVSAWMWAKEPVRPDFLVTAPVAPNYEMYPDYDARNYDVMGQHALIGNGINNGFFFDRALYPALLVYLHKLAGQNYVHIMALQAALYAVLPALVYLLGKRIHSRAAGLGLGILLAQRGVNSINVGDIIETAHQKHMLTEYPTAVLLVLVTYLLVKWAQDPQKSWKLAGLAGGIIGLSTLLRPHPLMLLPLIIALIILIYRHRTRLWLGISGLAITAAILSIVPWIQFSGHSVSVLDLYLGRIQDVIRQRYPQFNQPLNDLPAQTGKLHLSIARRAPEKSIFSFAVDNFLNNLVTSVQTLPNTPYMLEPRVLVKKTDNFWKPYWDGELTPWATALLPLNLLLLAIGLGSAWKRARISGLIPALALLAYFTANAFARVSGGRYLVPVDWIVVFYYLLGIFAVIEFGVSLFFQQNSLSPKGSINTSTLKPISWFGVVQVLLFSLVMGGLIPFSQKINSSPFAFPSKASLSELFIQRTKNKTSVTPSEIQAFLADPHAVITLGRSLYPRQFNKDDGLDISIYSFYHTFPYPRTLFTMIGPDRLETVIILPRTEAAKIANATDVLVLGCISEQYSKERFIRAWAVLRLDNNQLFERTPAAPLVCPLSEPICDDNKTCH